MARLNNDERKIIFDAINCMRGVNRELLDTYTVGLRTIQETEEAWIKMERLFNDGCWKAADYWCDYVYKAADKIVEESETNETK